MPRTVLCLSILLLPGSLALMTTAQADEGMWLLNDPPRQLLKERHGFEISDAWLERARLASIRFNSGGSGSFVSPDGLIVTNHHIGADALAKLSPPDKDYLRDGFHARNRSEELKCPDLELNVLQSIEDVTDRVNAAVKEGMSPAEAGAARRGVMATIEKESLEKTGLRSDVVTLYQGGKYHLYRYKKYTDVRLVMAPEAAIAGFGGDVDNFEYPRFDLDFCFFRAYENGQPAHIKHYFKWSTTGPAEGDVVFVTGHPGTTNRLETVAKLKHRRDITLPYTLARLRMLEAILDQFSARSPHNRKIAAEDVHRVANARKALTGQYQGLLDPAILARKETEEKTLRDKVQADAALRAKVGSAWDQVAKAQEALREIEKMYSLLERGDAFDSKLFGIARNLVRLAAEKPRANADRLREYRDSALESLEFQLFSPAPIFPELERVRLAAGLSWMAETLGAEHPLVVKILAGKSPAARAEELIAGTKLADPALRKQIAKDGQAAIDASRDPMILFAKLVDGEARSVRRKYEDEVEEPERQGNSKIAQARFAVLGTGVAPDATFTLRLAFGVVKGYKVDGEKLPFHTTFGGAFERAESQGNREPFALPRRWMERKEKLDLATPFNFVSTADTIGGNSGSPVLNRAGELVGINFDRNRHGLVRNFVYTDEQARHISVHSKAVLEALRKVYDADNVVAELLGK
jgi:hypothetical protein